MSVDATSGSDRRVPHLKVTTTTDFEGCERLIAASTGEADQPLLLATDWKLQSRPCGFAAGAQAIITWARRQRTPLLVAHVSGASGETAMDRLCERPHGMIAAMMAQDARGLGGGDSVRRALNERVRSQVVAMDVPEPRQRRAQELFLMCVDHSSKGHIRALYSPTDPPQVRSSGEFALLVEKAMVDVAPRHGPKKAFLARGLGSALHELFDNTDVHAMSDPSGRKLARSVRCINVAERSINLSKVRDHSLGAADVQGYVEATARVTKGKSHVRFIEVSVVDSGPGMAATIATRPVASSLSIEDEADLVRRCFLLRESGRPRQGYGHGLARVMDVVRSQRGLIRVRTGRLSLYRAFDPSSPEADDDLADRDTVVLDTTTGTRSVTPLARAEGTAISILIPVNVHEP